MKRYVIDIPATPKQLEQLRARKRYCQAFRLRRRDRIREAMAAMMQPPENGSDPGSGL